MSLLTTPSQTIGPYLRIGFLPLATDTIAPPGTPGERFTIRGRLSDGDGTPINDGVLEIWQADAMGKYAHPEDGQKTAAGSSAFRGFGRILTDGAGAFHFTTIKPGAVAGPDSKQQAPHLMVTLFMRGMLKHLITRMYFPDEPLNQTDPVLQLVPAERRATLVAAVSGESMLEWNIVSQGPGETVFFDL